MKFKDAVQQFDEANERGEVPHLQTGERRSVSESRRNAAVTAARAGLRRVTDRANVDEVELDPYAETLPEYAYRDAKERGLSRPGNYATDARLFLAGAEGRIHTQQRHGRRRVHPNWKDEYDALDRVLDRRDAQRNGVRAALIRLQNMALLAGIRRPGELPGRDTIEEWFAGEVSDGYVRKMLRAVRLIRGEQDDPALPNLNKRAAINERGVRSLEDLGDRLRAAGCEADPRELSVQQILQQLAPKVVWGVEKYLDRKGELSGETVKRAWGSASRLVAAAIRLGFDPGEIDHMSVFQSTVEVEADLEGPVAEKIPDDATQTVCPMSQILDHWAPRSWTNSPLELVGEYGEKPWIYTNAVRTDLTMIFAVADRAFGPEVRDGAEELWTSVEAQYEQLKKQIKDHNKGRTTVGHKDKAKIVDQIILPQLVCLGLPALARRVRRHRDRYYRRVEKHRQGEIEDRALHEARTRFFTWLRRYVITAVVVDDGLRVKNYAGAVLGESVFVEYEWGENEQGSEVPVSLDSVTTHFRGFEAPQYVRLKRRRGENNQDRQRRRQLLPGVVDHELLFDYLVQMRPYQLVEAGLLPNEEAYDPREDQFALFVSPQASNEQGRYSRESIAKTYGKTLLWICREVLGRDVPEWDSEEHREGWRELFAAHINRLLIGSYWGGIRGDWAHAAFLTDDTKDTLQDAYDSSASDVMQRKYQLNGWEHPQCFDDLMDRIRAGEEIDWKKVRRERSLL